MDLYVLVARLLEQHREAFARLLGEIQVAYDEAVAMLAHRFPDPRQIPGGTLCGVVRAIVLAMNGLDALSHTGASPRAAPAGASCGPGSTLRMSPGPNSSVRLGDRNLAKARVRKLAPDVVESLALLSPRPTPPAKPGAQLFLDDGQEQRVMGPAGLEQEYELVVYWWPTGDKASVAGAILAAVADLDTPEEHILVFSALPAAIRPKAAAELAGEVSYEPSGDFEQFFGGKSSKTGDSGA